MSSTRRLFVFFAALLAGSSLYAAKISIHAESEILWQPARSLSSSFDVLPLTAGGPLQHPILISGNSTTLAEAIPAIKRAYDAGQSVILVAPGQLAQSVLDDITGGDVDLPEQLASGPSELGQPRLEAFAFRRAPGSATADTAEFWVAFDDNDGTPTEEKAEDDRLLASIAQWLEEKPATPPAPPPAPRSASPSRPMLRSAALKADGNGRPSIDDLTTAVVKKVSFGFDQGSVSTVIRSWAAYSPSQEEDWYIFELTTNSQPQNFETQSLDGMFAEWQKGDDYCRGLAKTGCKRLRYATQVQVRIKPKTPGLELVYFGPDSDRVQDEYSYSSKFSLGGKITAGYDDKGPKGGVELSGGAEFSRSTKVTIKDATLVGISNPNVELAGWKFEMPQMRAVNDLAAYGGPTMSCDNLLQMPYPVQRGGMESKQYAIYRLRNADRAGLSGIAMLVSLSLQESSSRLQNWTAAYCNIFNCNCSPENWVHKDNALNDQVISLPLAAHPR